MDGGFILWFWPLKGEVKEFCSTITVGTCRYTPAQEGHLDSAYSSQVRNSVAKSGRGTGISWAIFSFMGFSFSSKVQCMRPPNSMVGKGAGRWSLTLARTYLYISRDSTQAKSCAHAISCGPQIYFRTGSQSEGASWGPRSIIGI